MGIIITAILAFAATNIDDLFLLTLFFGNSRYAPGKVVIGQVSGISTLIILSLGGSAIGSLLNPQYIGLMGLFPVYLGVKQLIELMRNKKDDDDADDASKLKHSSIILSVALVTIANGGDNIGIYIPLFATLPLMDKVATISIFLLMTLLWCMIARYLTRHPLLKNAIDRYGHVITPPILILLGIFILYESNAFVLLNVFF